MQQQSLCLDLVDVFKFAYPKADYVLIQELAELAAAEDDGFSDELFTFLFGFYTDNGEMPYGVAKARTGDPYEWVFNRVMQVAKNS